MVGELPVSERARRRITRRLMPFLLLLFIIAFLDRTNVGFASDGMKKDLLFDDGVIGTGAGIFFLGYFLLEIPGTLLVERWSARKWIARIMISWGMIAAIVGFIGMPWLGSSSPKDQFYILRFILGLAEAGFFPGVIVFLAHWFRYEDRAKAKSMFLIGIPLATIIAAPVSNAITSYVNWGGLASWRWMYILEGIPAVLIGIWTLFYLTDRPQDATWLPEDEKAWIVGEIENERAAKSQMGGADIVKGLMNPQVILMAVIYLFAVAGMYGLTFFLAPMLKTHKLPTWNQTLLNIIPYVLGLTTIILNGRHSDKTGERRWHTTVPLLLASLAMAGCATFFQDLTLSMVFLSLYGLTLYAYLPAFWTQPSSRLTASSAAVAIGLINSIGNLGGFVGPLMVGNLKKESHSFQPGLWFLAGCILVAGVLSLFLRPVEKKAS